MASAFMKHLILNMRNWNYNWFNLKYFSYHQRKIRLHFFKCINTCTIYLLYDVGYGLWSILLWLEISVNYAQTVQMVEGQGQLCKVEFHIFFCKHNLLRTGQIYSLNSEKKFRSKEKKKKKTLQYWASAATKRENRLLSQHQHCRTVTRCWFQKLQAALPLMQAFYVLSKESSHTANTSLNLHMTRFRSKMKIFKKVSRVLRFKSEANRMMTAPLTTNKWLHPQFVLLP